MIYGRRVLIMGDACRLYLPFLRCRLYHLRLTFIFASKFIYLSSSAATPLERHLLID